MFLEIDLNHELSSLNNTNKKKNPTESVNIFGFSEVTIEKPLKTAIELDINNYFENVKINKTNLNVVRILTLYLNLCYYFGIIPFRVVLDDESGLWRLKTSTVQKVI